jgi:hypothetical protein
MDYVRAIQRLGWKGTAQHLYMFRRIKEGAMIGVDQLGNKQVPLLDTPSRAYV